MANAVELADHTGAKITASNPLPVTTAGNGAVDDEVYSDPTGAADGSAISLLKGIYVQLCIIADNTSA